MSWASNGPTGPPQEWADRKKAEHIANPPLTWATVKEVFERFRDASQDSSD